MHEDTVCLLARKKKIKDEYKDPTVLPKINKSDMAGIMEAIEEYLRPCWGVMRAPVETYGDYPKYATPDSEMIARVLHLLQEKNKILWEKDAQTALMHKVEYKIDNKTVYDILNQIYKDTDLYQYVKQQKSKRDGRKAYYV